MDGVNSLGHQYGYSLYAPHNSLRLATGLGAGAAFALLRLPLFNSGLCAAPHAHLRVVNSRGDVMGISILLALVGMLGWQGPSWLFYPIVLLSTGGMIGGLFLVNLAAMMLLMGLYRRVLLLGQLTRPAAISLILTTIELVGLA